MPTKKLTKQALAKQTAALHKKMNDLANEVADINKMKSSIQRSMTLLEKKILKATKESNSKKKKALRRVAKSKAK